MNIVFISALEGGKYSGPMYSVPKQINYQSKIDAVFWVNLTDVEITNESDKNIYHYYSLKSFDIKKLPKPFCNPDLVIFEEFFKIECMFVAKKLEKEKIPYIIIPRCQMTKKYLRNKWFKKKIASILFFKHFSRKSLGVQFLSKQEYLDSVEYYKGDKSIIANGIDIPHYDENKQLYKKDSIVCTFIGRYSIWQKGLDLMIQSIARLSNDLKKANIIFNLYGPNERTGSKNQVEKLVKEYNVEDLVKVYGPVFDKDKEKVLKTTKLFIHTSRFEGMPMSVLEALSYGIPCIVTQGSNLREEIEEMNAGWGADNSVEDIVCMLKKLIKEIDKLEEKSSNAKNLALKYSWENIANESHNWYQTITKKRSNI